MNLIQSNPVIFPPPEGLETNSLPFWRKKGLWAGVLLGLVFFWSSWPTLAVMAERWRRDPQYSHGFLVPIFALVVLWCRKPDKGLPSLNPSWWGLPLLLGGVGLRLGAAHLGVEPLDAFSLLPILAGLVWFLGGGLILRWSWPALAFLAFMVPLPYQIEIGLGQPLRRCATWLSTYALQTLGYPALAEGNIIVINQVQLGVAEACSGLGMLFTFFALATAMALVVRAPLADRLVLVASAVPVAVLVNVVRITATGAAHLSWSDELAQTIMHDLAGWLMMPLALALLWVEFLFLKHLFVPIEPNRPLALFLPSSAPSSLSEAQGHDIP